MSDKYMQAYARAKGTISQQSDLPDERCDFHDKKKRARNGPAVVFERAFNYLIEPAPALKSRVTV